jgi:hypothetical protein
MPLISFISIPVTQKDTNVIHGHVRVPVDHPFAKKARVSVIDILNDNMTTLDIN